MSNIALANVQVPAHLANRVGVPSVLSQSMAGGIGAGAEYPRISIKGSRFRIVEGGVETVLDSTSLDIVVVGANPRLSKTWYAKQWTPESEPSSPDCYSLDGVSPDTASTEPQNDLCASCPQNAWGSKVTPQGKQIKACSDQKRLAVVSADDPTGPVYLLSVTPAAITGFGAYTKELSVRGIPAEIVRTRVSFDTDASFPKLKFGFGGYLDEATQAEVDKLFNTDAIKEITGELRTGVPAVPSLPQAAPAPVAPKPAPVAAPTPAPAPVAESQAAPKRGFGAPKTAAKAAPAPAAAAPVSVQATSADTLADEIANLIGEVNADDA